MNERIWADSGVLMGNAGMDEGRKKGREEGRKEGVAGPFLWAARPG